MYEQNTSMMNTPERNTFLLPAMVEGDFSSDEIAEDADGLQMMSFQRVKIPAGGALQFEIPTEDPDNPDYARTLEGVSTIILPIPCGRKAASMTRTPSLSALLWTARPASGNRAAPAPPAR